MISANSIIKQLHGEIAAGRRGVRELERQLAAIQRVFGRKQKAGKRKAHKAKPATAKE